MPIISSLFGIYVRMYFDEHEPPHVHVDYQGHEALVAYSDGRVMEGSLPRRAAEIVRRWCMDHGSELAQNWAKAKDLLPLDRIPGADHD